MELHKKAQFITDFYGSKSSAGAEKVLMNWIMTNIDRVTLSIFERAKKKGQEMEDVIQQILSIFHRDREIPIIGHWMLRRCLLVTGNIIFNAMKDHSHPKKSIVPMAVKLVEPISIQLFRDGKLIEKPDGITVCTITKGRTSFFKAYEYIKAGATFEATIYIDEELLTEDNINLLLAKCGSIGVGAFRERFGKFKWIE